MLTEGGGGSEARGGLEEVHSARQALRRRILNKAMQGKHLSEFKLAPFIGWNLLRPYADIWRERKRERERLSKNPRCVSAIWSLPFLQSKKKKDTKRRFYFHHNEVIWCLSANSSRARVAGPCAFKAPPLALDEQQHPHTSPAPFLLQGCLITLS